VRIGLRIGLLSTFVLLAVTGAHASQVLYGITNDDNLISIDVTTGVGTLIGTPGIAMNAIGIAANAGNLYVFDSSDSTNNGLRQIDPVTAAVTSLTSVGINVLVGEGDITYDSAASQWLFASTTLSDGSFDPTNGTLYAYTSGSASVVGSTMQFDGIAFGPGDLLFGLEQGGAAIDTINPANGSTTAVGSTGLTTIDPNTGFGLYGLGGMAYSGTAMYAVLSNFSDSYLYRINTSTGVATPVGSGIGFGQVSGIAFLGQPTLPGVPEPGTFALGGGALALLWIRRRAR